jgi:hypothetical protein
MKIGHQESPKNISKGIKFVVVPVKTGHTLAIDQSAGAFCVAIRLYRNSFWVQKLVRIPKEMLSLIQLI